MTAAQAYAPGNLIPNQMDAIASDRRPSSATMPLVFVDTETTGLDPRSGDRIVEVACVEVLDGHLTGREFHRLVNPQRPVPMVVTEIHGIDDEMLRNQPTFQNIAPELTLFVANSRTVIHNAPFDLGFFAAEFERLGAFVPQLMSPEQSIDTLPLFRQLHPGTRCSLSALCLRYDIVPTAAERWHSALTDARMLARLWLAARLRP